MMPELGKYAGVVLSSYAVSIGLIAVLVGASILRARKVRAELERIEERIKRGD
ncbi:heme exporter protein CcmD [Tropicibacter naphthalenivorans]|uniref:Heme exporter protein D n=1 Tax=Tropicibacter naphthalenivorans TaxID=441103 RepID=A0A0P1G4U2_9RHOB|nr:heme exporter protein CcmD [Tropicibacter naphthalenivorans]CUH76699.1 heme exporter protein CcmD [Tropicibacter naphthalenivorans]SMC63690.1 heme exporter protein D [Tropicibacter naphthalenivorans]